MYFGILFIWFFTTLSFSSEILLKPLFFNPLWSSIGDLPCIFFKTVLTLNVDITVFNSKC